jgi:hypothetical protein
VLAAGCSNLEFAHAVVSDMSTGGPFDLGALADASMCGAHIDITTTSPIPPATLVATTPPHGGTPEWSVSIAGGPTVVPDTSGDPSGLRAVFEATQAGSYTFSVVFRNSFDACPGSNTITLRNPTGSTVTYRLRISPPESAGVPQQDKLLTLVGGTPVGGHDLTLDSGSALLGTLRGPAGPIAGEVRLIADSGPDAVALADGAGTFQLAVRDDAMYTPLLVPRVTTLAPQLLARASGAALQGVAFAVDVGQSVSGSVADAAGQPVAGVRVALRAGKLPSGVGASGSDGGFALRAEPATYTLSAGAPGWPEVGLPGVAVGGGGTTVALRYLKARIAVAARVVASDGTTAVAGARVTLRSPLLDGLATVALGANAAADAPARVSEQLVSGSDGTLPSLQLPDGAYPLSVWIEPPAGGSDGVTALELPAVTPSLTLALAPRATLAGRVVDGRGLPVASAQVTAFETFGLGAAPATTTGTDGRYQLTVDRGSPIDLLVEPGASSMLSSARRALAAGATSADVTLPPGLLVAGKVRGPSAPLPSVLIEALCGSCGSPTPLTSTVSDTMGNYRLYLPDPGSVVDVDAGTD